MFDNDRRSHHGKRTGSWLGARKAHLNLLSFHEFDLRIILQGFRNMLLSILSLRILLRNWFPPNCLKDSKFFNTINQMPSPWFFKIYFPNQRTSRMCWDALSVPLMIFFYLQSSGHWPRTPESVQSKHVFRDFHWINTFYWRKTYKKY